MEVVIDNSDLNEQEQFERALAVVVDAFQQASLKVNMAEQANRTRYLENQVQDMANRLTEVRSQKSRYKQQSATVDVRREAARAEDTDWRAIVSLYDGLERIQPSPIVSLNRAVAVGLRSALVLTGVSSRSEAQDAPPPELRSVGEVSCLEGAELFIGHLGSTGRPPPLSSAPVPRDGAARPPSKSRRWAACLHCPTEKIPARRCKGRSPRPCRASC